MLILQVAAAMMQFRQLGSPFVGCTNRVLP